MSAAAPRLFTIAPGAPFLPTLAEALTTGRLIPGFDGRDPLALAGARIYLPTRRAARELRSVLVEQAAGRAAILPTITALGEFDEEGAIFDGGFAESLDLAPPIPTLDRLLLLAELVRAWKRRLPAHVASLFDEEVIVPASAADAIWHARDLTRILDEIETEDADWTKLGDLVSGDLAGWWQVTLDFLNIVTEQWPAILDERRQSNPAAHRIRLIRLEAERLKRNPPAGPVIAAGSTGSIPATCELLSVIARLERGAVVLPGLDRTMDERSWAVVNGADPEPAVLGHPQYGLAKLLRALGAMRDDVAEIGALSAGAAARRHCVGEALRPAVTTDAWAAGASGDRSAAVDGITLIDAGNERDEAAAIAIALKTAAAADPNAKVALVTPDRTLARRVSTELLRLGVTADDSGGTPLARTPSVELLTLLLEAVFTPGDPMSIVGLLKHPLLTLGLERGPVRGAAETIELVALRGGTGRPDATGLLPLFDQRLTALPDRRPPFWLGRLSARRVRQARDVLARLHDVLAPLAVLRDGSARTVPELAQTTVQALEALARGADGGVAALYRDDAGDRLADFLRGLVGCDARFALDPGEWPDVFAALIAPDVVKPRPGAESRIAIWGTLEARLQTVDLLVIGGLNEGAWPRKAEADRFLSRVMKAGLALEPPERRIGLAAHDFMMAMGARQVLLSRSARSGDAPAVASRWLQRLTTYVGAAGTRAMTARGETLLHWARQLDGGERQDFAKRPNPKPPVGTRPRRFSVTEIETLRRDPYAIYARRILGLQPLDPLIRDPGVADRGTLFHDILHRFTESGTDARGERAADALMKAGACAFADLALPADIRAIWWPRFLRMVPEILRWEAERAPNIRARHAEANAGDLEVGATGVTLRGRADRIDLLAAGMADILDYKTGSTPSKIQAHTLVAPQLALEGALLKRGAFQDLGRPNLADLAFVRLKANGQVQQESILDVKNQVRSADELADDAWRRLEQLILHYDKADTGYLSRALPFREGDVSGDYDHLARVLEWSAGGTEAEGVDT